MEIPSTDKLNLLLIITLCVTLLYLLLNPKTRSPPLQHSTVDKPPRKRNVTFRVRGVPLEWSINNLQEFLRAYNETASPRVMSLASEVYNRDQTGTVIFGNDAFLHQAIKTNSHVQISINNPLARQASRGQLLTIDTDFLGVTVLFTPPPENHRIELASRSRMTIFANFSSILAVSGLGGHAFGSFKHKNSDHMWLRDALPADIHLVGEKCPIARVMVHGYNSTIEGSESFQGPEDLASAFRESLLTLAHGHLRPIVLIGHSLGGIIIKNVRTMITLIRTLGL